MNPFNTTFLTSASVRYCIPSMNLFDLFVSSCSKHIAFRLIAHGSLLMAKEKNPASDFSDGSLQPTQGSFLLRWPA